MSTCNDDYTVTSLPQGPRRHVLLRLSLTPRQSRVGQPRRSTATEHRDGATATEARTTATERARCVASAHGPCAAPDATNAAGQGRVSGARSGTGNVRCLAVRGPGISRRRRDRRRSERPARLLTEQQPAEAAQATAPHDHEVRALGRRHQGGRGGTVDRVQLDLTARIATESIADVALQGDAYRPSYSARLGT